MTVSTFVSVPVPERKLRYAVVRIVSEEAELSVLPELLPFIVIYSLNI